MKILFINLPYQGHVIPTIGLVQELIKKGCQVTYLLPFDWEEEKYYNLCLATRNHDDYDQGEKYWFDDNTMVEYVPSMLLKEFIPKV